MADTDSYEHLYDLPETTSTIGTDVLPIEQSDGTKKIEVTNLLKAVPSYADVYTKTQTDTVISNTVNTQNTVNGELAGNFASEYSPSAKYAASAYCTYQNVLYKCKTAITTPEAWNSAHWTAAKVMDEIAYPVGAIYLSVNSTSPAALFGGTWEQIKDTFLLACGNTYTAGSTGGEAQHTLTVDEMPRHSHSADNFVINSAGSGLPHVNFQSGGSSYFYIGNEYTIPGYTGSGADHNNMPPYLAVYMWKRIA